MGFVQVITQQKRPHKTWGTISADIRVPERTQANKKMHSGGTVMGYYWIITKTKFIMDPRESPSWTLYTRNQPSAGVHGNSRFQKESEGYYMGHTR